MYLSRLILNPRSRAVRNDLADCQQLHRTVMRAFPQASGADARDRMGVLHCIDQDPRTGAIRLTIQSRVAPDWSVLTADYLGTAPDGLENPATRRLDGAYDRLADGQRLRFRLRANPTKRLSTPRASDGRRPNGKRVALRDEESWNTWLARKAEHGGFRVLSARARSEQALGVVSSTGRRPTAAGESKLTLDPVLFEGEIAIVDRARFRATLEDGIGSGKAYGFGLLQIAPPR